MARTLYELAGADAGRRFSPYCWRARFSLLHKGLDFETEPVRFTQKDKIAFSGQDRVPVLKDGKTVVSDSLAIADYLEENYADGASLFGGSIGRAEARFINDWADRILHPAMLPLVILDIYQRIAPEDQDYFRQSREGALGTSLEDFASNKQDKLAHLKGVLTPLQATLSKQAYLAGDSPAYADYIIAGSFMWVRCVGGPEILDEQESAIRDWRERLLDLFDGQARQAVCG